MSFGFITQNTAVHTKKVVLKALCFITNRVSNTIGPHLFKAKQAPLYLLGMGAILGSYVLSILTIVLDMTYRWNENRQRDRAAAAVEGDCQEAQLDTDFMDLTDKQNPQFRHVW